MYIDSPEYYNIISLHTMMDIPLYFLVHTQKLIKAKINNKTVIIERKIIFFLQAFNLSLSDLSVSLNSQLQKSIVKLLSEVPLLIHNNSLRSIMSFFSLLMCFIFLSKYLSAIVARHCESVNIKNTEYLSESKYKNHNENNNIFFQFFFKYCNKFRIDFFSFMICFYCFYYFYQ